MLDDLTSRGSPDPNSSSSIAAKASRRRSPACGTTSRCALYHAQGAHLLAHAPNHLLDEIKAEFNDIVHADSATAVLARRKAFLAKSKLRSRAVADSLEEAGERLFTFLRYPSEQWRSLRTTNAIERLHEEFKRRIKTQCLLPCAETAAMLFWALLASFRSPCAGSMAGPPSTAHPPILTSPPEPDHHAVPDPRRANFHHLRDTILVVSQVSAMDTRSGRSATKASTRSAWATRGERFQPP